MEKNTDLNLTFVQCCICKNDTASAIGKGKDFEYHTSTDTFYAVQCSTCGLVYLNPRPDVSELETIYPSTYHAFNFSENDFGFVYKVRSRLEAGRLLKKCSNLPPDAKILDVGCGDGFHLGLLKQFGKKSWTLEGVDIDSKAVKRAIDAGLNVHLGTVEELDLPTNNYDLVFMIMTIEHVEQPDVVLQAVHKLLRPGGRVVIVTDNTDALDFKLFKKGHWGGYHFPRHWNLFNKRSFTQLAKNTDFNIDSLKTIISPVNWVYSIHNKLVDRNAPKWLINCFTLKSTVSLTAFTALDFVLQKFNKGALLQVTLQKPLN
ncbi:MAG: class I SAM-dependent methyltransferase [Ferruginibacter sp.]